MGKLILTLNETRELKKYGVIDIVRNGQDSHIEQNEYSESGYNIYIINHYDAIVLAKEPKVKQTAILKGGEWILTRGVKYTTLCYSSGTIYQRWKNEYIDYNLGDFEYQAKWFEENLK